MTDTIDHYDYARYLAMIAIDNFDRGDIHDCLDEYTLEHSLDVDELSGNDVDLIRSIMYDMASHIA